MMKRNNNTSLPEAAAPCAPPPPLPAPRPANHSCIGTVNLLPCASSVSSSGRVALAAAGGTPLGQQALRWAVVR